MNKKTILIIEDEAINILMLRSVIESIAGLHLIGHAMHADEAYKVIIEQKPDFILVDIKLKADSSGLSLVANLESEGKLPTHIFCTAYNELSMMELMQVSKPAAILTKPINEFRLRTVIEKLLQA